MEIAARDEKIRQLSAMLDEGMAGNSGLAEMRIRELEDVVAQLQDMLKSNEQQMLSQVQARINELQEELSRLRLQRAGQPRDFTDKSVTSHEMLRQLKCNVENLQKELADRDVLLESQNEKIGDMDREIASSRQRLQTVMVDKGENELRREVESARGEVEKLLKMVRQLEKENTQLSSQCKQLQSAIDRGGTESSGTLTKGDISSAVPGLLSGGMSAQAKKRIEELEEALRESV
ncbi:hypothetical protein OESDEN_13787, partial [Oesophagostomum dentatum]